MKKVLVVCGLPLAVAAPFLMVPMVVMVLLGGINRPSVAGAVTTSAGAAGIPPGTLGLNPGTPGIPPSMLALYQQAAGACPGLDWRVLAAIGTVESDNGASPLPGVHSGKNPAGAEGPMQFEPDTFVQYSLPVPPGGAEPPSPYDAVDAVYAAERMLCANGAADGSRLARAVFAYNHSEPYVANVLRLAGSTPPAEGTDLAGTAAAGFALAQVGTPYRWGAERPGYGFDCSGLAQAAWRAAGIQIPRVAQAQHDAVPAVLKGAAPEPGDLVFFGPEPGLVSHVGIVVGNGIMVDAPHAGSAVRVETFPVSVGVPWGGDVYLGAARPIASR